jgi:hypothetical protein
VALFDGLKARLDRLFRERTWADPRAYAAGLREALLEAKLGLAAMRDGIAATQRELEAEQKHLADAERRGRLAGAVPDAETVAIAERFAARHRERAAVLERKLVVQRDELLLAEREVRELADQYRTAASGSPSSASIDAAWRDLQSAGASRPSSEEERFEAESDQRRREQAVEEQLAYLKRKLGKQQ